MNGPIAYLCMALFQMLALLVVYGEDALAFQIRPSPNQVGNTIIITSPLAENLTGFSNQGAIEIRVDGKLRNAGSLENSGIIGTVRGGAEGPPASGFLTNEGTLRNAIRQTNGQIFSGQINNNGQMTNSGTLINQSTTIRSSFPPFNSVQYYATITNNGIFTNNGTIESQGVITNTSSFENNGTVKNQGKMDNFGFSVFKNNTGSTLENGGTFTNNGVFVNSGHVSNLREIVSTGDFTNGLATGRVTENGLAIIDAGTITNNGAIKIENGGGFGNFGSTLTNNGALNIAGNFFNFGFDKASTVLNSGTIAVAQTGKYWQDDGGIRLDGTVTNTQNDGTFTNRGTVQLNTGSFTVGTAGRYEQQTGSTHVDGTFTNRGTVQLNAGGFTVGVPGQYEQQTGSTQVDGRFTNFGRVQLLGGNFTVGPRGQYVQETSTFPPTGSTQVDGTFTNKGQVDLEHGSFTVGKAGQYVQEAGGSTVISTLGFINQGRVQSYGNMDVSGGRYTQLEGGSTRIDGVFTNNNIVQLDAKSDFTVATKGQYVQERIGSTQVDGTFTNQGTVTVQGRVETSTGLMTVGTTGQFVQEASGTTQINGTFSNTGGRVNNEGAITVGTTGVYHQDRSCEFPCGGPVTPVTTINTGTFTNAGTVQLGLFTDFRNTGGQGVGEYRQLAGGTTRIDGSFTNSAHVSNAGAITVGVEAGYFQHQSCEGPCEPATTTNTGSFTNAGITVIDAGTFANQGSVVNSGTFQVAALGHVSGVGSYEQISPGGETIVNGTFGNNIDLRSGTLSGTGTITGAVVNTGGMVQPGSSVLPGTLTLASYTQGAEAGLHLKIGGLLAGSQYDVLKVAGPVSLHGFLSVSLIDGFVPKLGNEFNLITGSSFDVGVRQVSLPRLLAGMDWLTSFAGGVYNLTVRQVVVSAPEPSSLLLSGFGFAWLVGWRWRRQQNRRATN